MATNNGQRQIFDEWLQRHQALIFKVVRAYARTAMDREDLFQEIAIQVWHSVPAFKRESSIVTWLYRIALNTAIKWIRKEGKHQHAKEVNETGLILEQTEILPDDRLTWLYEEIHKLNAIDRSITLLLLDNFSYREMAGILGISESNVGVKINRIKKYLITKSKNNNHGI